MTQLILAISLWGVIFLIIMVLQFMWSTSFWTALSSRKLCRFLFMFSTGSILFSTLLLFLYQSRSSTLWTVFDAISSNTDKVLSINPSAVFAFCDFNIHHKDWLTYSGGSDRLTIIFLSQMTLLRWFTFLLESLVFWPYMFYNSFPSIGKFWCCCFSFHWLSIKLRRWCPVSSHSLSLFSCWLG